MMDYRDIYPAADESALEYTRRLELDGHDEMFIRKALSQHFGMPIEAFADFFEAFELARLRHVAIIAGLRTYPNDRSFLRKVRLNLGISTDRAAWWVQRFRDSGMPGQGVDMT